MKTLLIIRIINACFTLLRNLKKHRSILKSVGKHLQQGADQLHQWLNKPHVVITKGLSVVITPAFVLRSYMALHIRVSRVVFFFAALLTFANLILSGVPIYIALIGTGIASFFGKIGLDQFEKLNEA